VLLKHKNPDRRWVGAPNSRRKIMEFPILWILFGTVVIPNAEPKVREVFLTQEDAEIALHSHDGEIGVAYDIVKYTPINPLDTSSVV
jgi:hypothetical protein